MQSEYAIEMIDITKIFPGIVANDHITLRLKKGEIHALLGENGAGKTTLLRTLLGERQYKGSISFTDHHGVVMPVPRIGYVPQHLDFDKSMPISVSDFIAAAKGGSPVWQAEKNAGAYPRDSGGHGMWVFGGAQTGGTERR